jgi:phosphomannomutase/phosphoglucomutase
MITASHNPPNYNGLKIRADDTLHGDDLQQIYQLAVEAYKAGTAVAPHTPQPLNPIPDYFQQLKIHAQSGRRLKVVVDGGSGANGRIVSQLLTDLDCDVVQLYCEPDGRFPHRQPDPTAAGATHDLAATVLAHQAHLGFAYDGDGDRVVIVDEQGQTVYGDQIMMLLARDILQATSALHAGPATIVYEVLCSQALADDIVAHGGQAVMTPSGYFFIQQAMKAETAALGGELSGHLFLNEPGFRFDDAILATVKLLNIVRGAERPLSHLTADLPSYYSSPEIRLTCADNVKTAVVQQAITHYQKQYHVETIDGARIHFPDGWGLVRQSNTQPKISMRFEARSAAALQAIQNDVQAFVETTINQLNS